MTWKAYISSKVGLVLAARHNKADVPLLDTVYHGLVYARVALHPEAQDVPEVPAPQRRRRNRAR